MTSMRVIVQDGYGATDEVLHLGELQIPMPAAHEVVDSTQDNATGPETLRGENLSALNASGALGSPDQEQSRPQDEGHQQSRSKAL